MDTSSCEMCGKESILLQAKVENSIMSLCSRCARFGTILDHPQERPRQTFHHEKPAQELITFVTDFHLIIRKAREQKHMTQPQLAHILAEKESVITKIEAGHYTPEIKLARKLEQFLGIKITETYKPTDEDKPSIDFKQSHLTIGDLIKKK